MANGRREKREDVMKSGIVNLKSGVKRALKAAFLLSTVCCLPSLAFGQSFTTFSASNIQNARGPCLAAAISIFKARMGTTIPPASNAAEAAR
jgi:hypothetical protein